MKKFVDIIERIEYLRNHLGLNKSRFSAAIGMKPQTYNNFIGSQGSKPNVELIVGVVDKFRVDPQWLLTGEGAMIEDGENPGSDMFMLDSTPQFAWVRETMSQMGLDDNMGKLRELRRLLMGLEPSLIKAEQQIRKVEIEQIPSFERITRLIRRYFEIDPAGAISEIRETLTRIENSLAMIQSTREETLDSIENHESQKVEGGGSDL